MDRPETTQQVRQQRQVLFWSIAAVLFVLAVLALQEILLPFVAGIVLAYALNPLTDRLERSGIGRLAASGLTVALLIVIFIIVLLVLIPLLVQQIQQIISSLPSDLATVRPKFEAWALEQFGSRFESVRLAIDEGLVELQKNWTGVAGSVARGVWDQGWAIIDFLAILLITPVVVFYLLVDWPQMIRRLGEWLPRDHEASIRRVVGEMDAALAAFIRGQGLVCLILGTLYTAGLTAMGLRYGLLVGIFTGILTFVPVVGSALGLITASILAIVQGWPDLSLLAMVVALFAAGQALDAGFLAPRIVGPKVGLHPVALIFALFVFSYLFGFVGVLVAVPMAAAIGVLIRFALELYLQSTIYRGAAGERVSKAPDNITE
jgi:predicted PurR-regulated permease PerM